jgi:type I restriction enzyme S subunit
MNEHARNNGDGHLTLPLGWAKACIGQVIHKLETASPISSAPGDFLYVDIQAVDNASHRIVAPKTLPRAAPPSRARHVIRAGDVIISLVRPRLKNIAIVPEQLDAQWASTAFCVCRPRKGVDPRYLHHLFIQDEFVEAVKTYGDSPPSGHDDDLIATEIPVPPSGEQSRIADRLDELLTDLAAGMAALERVKKKLKRYRSAVLHAAVTGRLTAAWRKSHGPPAEPGNMLLARILLRDDQAA